MTGWPKALNALDLILSADELAAIEAAVPAGAVAGERYEPAQVAMLDSKHGKRPGTVLHLNNLILGRRLMILVDVGPGGEDQR